MAYGQILPKSVLDIPPVACLNLHASLLPRHRGAAPIQAAIVAGDTETGITVMYMDEGLDTGDILLAERNCRSCLTKPADRSTIAWPSSRPRPCSVRSTCSTNRNAPRIPQDSAQASYAPRLTREDGRINWKEPAVVIERKIRAYDPWPGAFTQLAIPSGAERNLKIFRVSVSEQSVGEPGTMITPNESELLVATGRGALRLEEVQLEGKRRMKAAEFLRGFSSPRLHF